MCGMQVGDILAPSSDQSEQQSYSLLQFLDNNASVIFNFLKTNSGDANLTEMLDRGPLSNYQLKVFDR